MKTFFVAYHRNAAGIGNEFEKVQVDGGLTVQRDVPMVTGATHLRPMSIRGAGEDASIGEVLVECVVEDRNLVTEFFTSSLQRRHGHVVVREVTIQRHADLPKMSGTCRGMATLRYPLICGNGERGQYRNHRDDHEQLD